jgi:hypothetical protein
MHNLNLFCFYRNIIRVKSFGTARIPSIKFIGKRSHVPKAAPSLTTIVSSHSSTKISTAIPIPTPKNIITKDLSLLDGVGFGRSKLTQAEMDAIESGGATLL